jgi:hypothetical protein
LWLANVNLDQVLTNSNLKNALVVMNNNAREADKLHLYSLAKNEQPYISDVAWTYFNAYHVIIQTVYTLTQMVERGSDPRALIPHLPINGLLKEIVPDESKRIDEEGLRCYVPLVEQLEAKLLSALRNEQQGEDQDTKNLAQITKVLAQTRAAVSKLQAEGAVFLSTME